VAGCPVELARQEVFREVEIVLNGNHASLRGCWAIGDRAEKGPFHEDFADRLYFVILVRVPGGVMRALLWAATVENNSPRSGLA